MIFKKKLRIVFVNISIKLIVLFFCTSVFAFSNEIFIDEELKEANLNPKIVERQPIADDSSRIFKRSADPLIDIEFGLLTHKQFKILSDFYLHRSLVTYDSGRKYYLTDFLTPQMQALWGKDFHDELTKKTIPSYQSYLFDEHKKTEGELKNEIVRSVSQCWGTAWNNLYILQNKSENLHKFDVLFVDENKVRDYLQNDMYSNEITMQDPRKYGDLTLWNEVKSNGTQNPFHFSIYAGFGHVYEKQDNSVGEPFRLVSYEKVRHNVERLVVENHHTIGSSLLEERRRFLNVEGIEKLPRISRVAPLYDNEAIRYFGLKTAAVLSATTSTATFGGRDVPEASLNTRIGFEINSTTGRGEIRRPYQKYFSEAYEKNLSCRFIFN